MRLQSRGSTVKTVNFNRPLDYEIKRVRGGAIIVSLKDKTKETLTAESIKALTGVPLKLRFNGLSRAQMGNVLAALKSDGTVTHVKPILQRKTQAGRINRKIYFDTVIEEK
jgi:hypothetical protein